MGVESGSRHPPPSSDPTVPLGTRAPQYIYFNIKKSKYKIHFIFFENFFNI